jgi:putative glycosyltransferase
MDLSIVTTLYQSAPYVKDFHERASAAAESITEDFEIVFVNDGSPDESLAAALERHAEDDRVRVVDFSRNFGHHKAIMTGLDYANGKKVFLIDSDLEEPPELLDTFWDKMRTTECDVVYGVQRTRKGNWFERAAGAVFYAVFNLLSPEPIPRNLITARLMTRPYVDALLQHREREICIAGLWAATGFQQEPVVVDKGNKGQSVYDLRRKFTNLVNAITSFSNRPLVFIFYLGSLISIGAAMAAAYLIIYRLFIGPLKDGWPSLMVSIWLLGGLTIFSLGVIGIYLSKIFTETKQRPYTIVRQVYERNGNGRSLS